jgi:hypothetical protein
MSNLISMVITVTVEVTIIFEQVVNTTSTKVVSASIEVVTYFIW